MELLLNLSLVLAVQLLVSKIGVHCYKGVAQPLPYEVSQKVEITLSAMELPGADTTSKSDPFCVVYKYAVDDTGKVRWDRAGITEYKNNNHNPRWTEKIPFTYHFQEELRLRFDIYDKDTEDYHDLTKQKLLGIVDVNLRDLVEERMKGNDVVKEIQLENGFDRKQGKSKLQIVAQSVLSDNWLQLQFQANNLLPKNLRKTSSCPFLQVCKRLANGSLVLLHRTEEVKKNLNPQWNEFRIRLDVLTFNWATEKIEFQVWHRRGKIGGEVHIGTAVTNFQEFNQAIANAVNPDTPPVFRLFSVEKVDGTTRLNQERPAGVLELVDCQVSKEKTFLDMFTTREIELNFSISIDFTGSSAKLHHPSHGQPNWYKVAIQNVGQIIEYYDMDKLFPTFGFGATIDDSSKADHCFPISLDTRQTEYFGIAGVLAGYDNLFLSKRITLSAPTYLSHSIRNAINLIPADSGNKYFVLLIITDGEVDEKDIAATTKAIIHASFLPMSIIIVGVGNADFSLMKFLDSDDAILRYKRKRAARDIVQFVAMQDAVEGREYATVNQYNLARDVLAELPRQILQWKDKQLFV